MDVNRPLKYRMPAEWEPHAATHLAWPANSADWPGKFAAARWAFVEMIRRIAAVEPIRLMVNDVRQETRARAMLCDAGVVLPNIHFHPFPLDRGWMRDISPCFVYDRRGKRVARHFRFTGWAKYANHLLDAQWPPEAARVLGMKNRAVMHKGVHVALEGGAIDVNGKGSLVTTEECLLHATVQTRNPGFGRKDYETCFRAALGVENVIWLGAGVAGDDTHGHVDDVCRFVNPNTLALCRETDSRDVNYRVLEENRERLQGARLENGARPDTVFLPMPEPLYFRGLRLPASYANFYIANGLVIVPTFNDPHDATALGILGELFPDRVVTGIHAVDLVWGFGTLHCLSHEEPAEAPKGE